MDETFIAASPKRVARVVADQARWRDWFPDLSLAVFMDRGQAGIRWSVTGSFVGSTEIWLEPFADGVILHYYLRVDPTSRGSRTQPDPYPITPKGRRTADQARVRAAQRAKQLFWDLKDELEGGRGVGMPAEDQQKIAEGQSDELADPSGVVART